MEDWESYYVLKYNPGKNLNFFLNLITTFGFPVTVKEYSYVFYVFWISNVIPCIPQHPRTAYILMCAHTEKNAENS